jgi:hypothetical protein
VRETENDELPTAVNVPNVTELVLLFVDIIDMEPTLREVTDLVPEASDVLDQLRDNVKDSESEFDSLGEDEFVAVAGADIVGEKLVEGVTEMEMTCDTETLGDERVPVVEDCNEKLGDKDFVFDTSLLGV